MPAAGYKLIPTHREIHEVHHRGTTTEHTMSSKICSESNSFLSVRGTKAQTQKHLRKDPKEAGGWENLLLVFG